jgi:hypothetical protein
MSFSPLTFMASKANIGLGNFCQHLIIGGMDGMAGITRDTLALMLASCPVRT